MDQIRGLASDRSGTAAYCCVMEIADHQDYPVLHEQGYMEFDISTLTIPVASAVFTLTGNFSNVSAPQNFDVFGLTGNGLSISHDLGFYFLGTLIGSFSYLDGNVSFDVTGFINSQIALDDPAHRAGIKIVYAGGPTDGDRTDAIVNFNAGSFQPAPILSIDVRQVPAPATVPLVATGLGLIAWVVRRKQANRQSA